MLRAILIALVGTLYGVAFVTLGTETFYVQAALLAIPILAVTLREVAFSDALVDELSVESVALRPHN
jgi:hypothetical protein